MIIKHRKGDLHGARFKRAGVTYFVLGSATPDGHVCAIRADKDEPSPVYLLAKPRPEEIHSSTPVDAREFEERPT